MKITLCLGQDCSSVSLCSFTTWLLRTHKYSSSKAAGAFDWTPRTFLFLFIYSFINSIIYTRVSCEADGYILFCFLWAAAHVVGMFAPDKKLLHGGTVRQQLRQNHQIAHWEVTVIQPEKRHCTSTACVHRIACCRQANGHFHLFVVEENAKK